MLKPWINPRSKFYWFRRRIPKACRRFGMPAEIKFSLETTDYQEALFRCNEHNLKLERQWQAALVGTPAVELSHLQITALAGEFYRDTVAARREDPGHRVDWEQSLARIDDVRSRRMLSSRTWRYMYYSDEARAYLQSRGINLVDEAFHKFIEAFVEAKAFASKTLLENAKRNYEPDKVEARYPDYQPPSSWRRLEDLWPQFCEQKLIAKSTAKKWRPYMEEVVRRSGHPDLGRVTQRHLLDWRDSLLAAKRSPIGIKDGHLAAAKSFFGWAKRAQKLATDPSVGVFVEVNAKHKKKLRKEMRGFTDKEAKVILSAALAPMSKLMTKENAAARRWVPWLCAYTGARVNEITQLRSSDVLKVDGIDCIRITPEAGTVKTGGQRIVPLHPHLVEDGFVAWAKRKKPAPLFYSEARQRKPDRQNPTYASVGNKLAEWVRKDLGIEDPLVAPNHGWRHRFKTVARKVRMDPEVRDVVQGHAPRTQGEDYGEFPPEVMLREIEKLPRYEVAAGKRRDRRRRDQKTYRAAANS